MQDAKNIGSRRETSRVELRGQNGASSLGAPGLSAGPAFTMLNKKELNFWTKSVDKYMRRREGRVGLQTIKVFDPNLGK